MSLQHFSHPHPLILIERKEMGNSDDESDEMLCYGCDQPLVQPSACDVAVSVAGDADVYICGEDNCDDAFYLHKKCAESPKEIQHPMHDPHPLTLRSRDCVCNVCGCGWEWFTYNCDSCAFDVCIRCASVGDRSFQHDGHGQHTLTLMRREALFKCDACGTEGKDLSYACNSCDFWMHKSCAASPKLLEAADIHRHPLVLTYSLPVMHRNFQQKCRICQKKMNPIRWLYYCDECTYFAHIKCLAKQISFSKKDTSEDEAQEENTEEDGLVRFPVDSKESFLHLMIDQFNKWNLENSNINLQKSNEDHPLDLQKLDGSISTGDHLQALINHWSHKDHPLELLHELLGSEQVEEIICNGCIQPITPAVGHPFYWCIQCDFFLHKFCLQLPPELPAGAFSRHPQHPLLLCQQNMFFSFRCAACGSFTNGFYYWCKTCCIGFDILCCFLPNRIKHQSHNHPLLHSSPSNSRCDACGYLCTDSKSFKCERMWMSCNFLIHQGCALLSATMRHRWDPHPIPLIYPPLDHQGLIYCEICEDQIDPNFWLYHCSKCDHSFHTDCLRPLHNLKVGDKKLFDGLHNHTITFVVKKKEDHHGPFSCSGCSEDLGDYRSIFECANCEMLFCVENCVASHS